MSQLWDRVQTSLWFVPGLMALGAMLLALLTPALDRAIPDDRLSSIPFVFSGRPIGARTVLSTIATSMITTAGVVFSMTIVSLQLASSQFGPRLLRTFLRDRGNQVVLGTFVGIFLYCILVLPTIDTTVDSVFVPHIAVSTALVLAVIGLAMLVYFIDHVAQSIHADAVIRAVGTELDTVIDHLFPEAIGESGAEGEPLINDADDPSLTPTPIRAEQAGYLRFFNGDAILCAAIEHDARVRVLARPGQFVFDGEPLASVTSTREVSGDLTTCVTGAFVIGAHRTPLQDAPFAFEQLAEMAVRALSPGINDPTTALHCINRIGAGLARLVTRRLPSPYRRDDDGVVRIIADPVALEHILQETIDPIARHAGVQLPVWLCLLQVLERVDARAQRAADRAVVRPRARTFASEAKEHFGPDQAERLASASAWATDG